VSLKGRNLLADSSDTDQCCTTDGCHCSGNPTQRSCPVHRAYAILDPNLKKYDSLDCSVVVYDVHRLLHELTDDDKAQRVRQELSECPCGTELIEMEGKLRRKLHTACEEHAPDSVRERLCEHVHQWSHESQASCAADYSERTDKQDDDQQNNQDASK